MLLINPCYPNRGFLPPIGLVFISSVLEKLGIRTEIIDCLATKDYKKKIISSLKEYSTVGISAGVGSISSALDIASMIRKDYPKTRIIFGGPHSTAIYDKLIPKYADIVVLGEGENTITELMQKDDLSGIKGIAYQQNGSVKVTPRRPFIDDLDRLPIPAWHLLDLNKYRFGCARLPLASIITSRGCPYHCIYCTKFVHGYEIRLRSVENVLAEIDYLVKKQAVKEVYIADDNFTFHPERIKRLSRMIIEKKYKDIRFSVGNGVRADIGDFEMFKLLRQAGFYSASFGVETGSQEVSDKLKRGLQLSQVKERIEMAKKAGMKVTLDILIGSPFDAMETTYRTVDFARSLCAHNVSFNMVVPFPGTEFYKMVEEKGRFLYDLKMNTADIFGKATYEIGNLKARDFERMYKKAHQRYYFRLRPFQIWTVLNYKIYSFGTILGLLRYAWGIIGAVFFKEGRIKKIKIK